MKSFINDDFLLDTGSSRDLYHSFAANQPIIDYHCHLSPVDLATNREFNNLFEIWLAGDHYKWRAMRLNGEEESLCTGKADPYEKFQAFARTVPKTLRNPLHHWTHLELKRYFGIETLLDESSSQEIWEEANRQLKALDTWGILKKFDVRFIGTSDDPTDSLETHVAIAKSGCPATVAPSFRPDKAFTPDQPERWNGWVDALAIASGRACDDFYGFLSSLSRRMDAFAECGCRASDHGIERCPEFVCSESKAQAVYDVARQGKAVSTEDAEGFTGFLLCWLGERYFERGWAMQFHLGALRNVNGGMFEALGADIGCDSITDVDQIKGLATILGELSRRGALPKTILYNLDPSKNYPFATMCGNFFQTGSPGHVQFGSGWWFLDQLEGMTWQINALSNLGLLGHFVGMLTDSRSFMSFPRHEYFRRLLCRILGQDIEAGFIPNEVSTVGEMVSDISFRNANRYFNLNV